MAQVGAGRTTTYAYDATNRPTTKTLPGGAVVAFTHTATGQRATATDARGTTAYAYDDRDRLTALTYPDGRRLLYAHDAAGTRTSLTAVLGATTLVTTYAHDPLGRLDSVTDPEGRVYDHGYDENGNRASLAHPNGVTTTYTYDAANRLTSLGSLGSGGAAVQSYGYTLGLAGNRTAVLEHDGTTRAYTYDALFRLTAERVTGAAGPLFEDAFTYDPVGNRLRLDRTDAGGTTTTPSTYDTRDRLLTAGAETLTWDANGNLTAKTGPAGATYTWDAEDRLVRVEKPDGTVVTHAYDADGNRVRTEITPATGPPTVRDLLVDTSGPLSHVVAETDAGGELAAYNVRGDDLLAVLRPTVGPRFFHADGLGSIRALTDETGAVTDRYTFTAFGELLDHQGADENAYLFAGEPLDPNSGFYYLRARWMDPGAGRFVGMDPFGGFPELPLSQHKYLYASANPANMIDPTGELTYAGTLTGFGIQTSLSTIVLPFALATAVTCAAIAVASLASPATFGPPGLDRCNLNQMTVQLLRDSDNLTHSATAFNTPRVGVTSLQMRNKMLELFATRAVAAPWFPGRYESELVGAIVAMSQKIGAIVSGGGVIQGGQVAQVRFPSVDPIFRLDLENRRGHNLRH